MAIDASSQSTKGRPLDQKANQKIGLPVWLITAVLILTAVYIAIFFAVSFPYSLGIAELSTFAIFVFSLSIFKYNKYHLIAPLLLLLFLVIQLAWFVRPAELEAAGLAREDFSSIYRYFPYLQTKMDISLAVDTFLQHLLFLLVILLTFYLSINKRIRFIIYSTISIIGIVTIILGLVAPRDNSRILWFYSLPKVEIHDNENHNYVSPIVHILSSSMNGFIWKYHVGDAEVSLDQKQISTNPLAGIVNENQYACLLLITFPFVVGLIILFLDRSPPLMFVAIAAVSVALLLLLIKTLSRGGALAGVASLMSLFVIRKGISHTLATFFCAFVAMLIISIVVSTFRTEEAVAFSSGRVIAWHETLKLFFNNPLFGIGLGNFPGQEIIVNPKYHDIWYASHNVYLQLLAELGIIGLGTYIISFVLIAKGIIHKGNPASLRIDYKLITISISILFIIIYSALDYSVSMPFNAFLASMVVGLFMAEVYIPSQIEEKSKRSHAIPKISLVMLLIPSIYLAILKSSMEEQLQTLKKAIGESIILNGGNGIAANMDEVLESSIESFSHFPYSAEYSRQIGLGCLVLSKATGGDQMRKAHDWLALSQTLGAEDRHMRWVIDNTQKSPSSQNRGFNSLVQL